MQLSKLIPGLAAALAFAGPGGEARELRHDIGDCSPTKRYRNVKLRRIARSNHRHRANVNAKDRVLRREKLDLLNGRPPGYRIQHHDALVRKFGARRAAKLERSILAGRVDFADAIAAGAGDG